MQERVYKTSVRDTADLKQRLTETWSGIPQTVINHATDEWGLWLRLRACFKAKRQHFEPPNATRQQPALFKATNILSKDECVC